jgi:hypothetical protein
MLTIISHGESSAREEHTLLFSLLGTGFVLAASRLPCLLASLLECLILNSFGVYRITGIIAKRNSWK